MNNDYASIFSSILKENQIKTNEPMKRHTTFGIGGPADCFLMPETTEEVCLITKLAHKHAVPLFVLGGGANLLVRGQRHPRGGGIHRSSAPHGKEGKSPDGRERSAYGSCCKESIGVWPLRNGICKRHSRQYWRSCLYECGSLWWRNGEDHRFCYHL